MKKSHFLITLKVDISNTTNELPDFFSKQNVKKQKFIFAFWYSSSLIYKPISDLLNPERNIFRGSRDLENGLKVGNFWKLLRGYSFRCYRIDNFDFCFRGFHDGFVIRQDLFLNENIRLSIWIIGKYVLIDLRVFRGLIVDELA